MTPRNDTDNAPENRPESPTASGTKAVLQPIFTQSKTSLVLPEFRGTHCCSDEMFKWSISGRWPSIIFCWDLSDVHSPGWRYPYGSWFQGMRSWWRHDSVWNLGSVVAEYKEAKPGFLQMSGITETGALASYGVMIWTHQERGRFLSNLWQVWKRQFCL